MEKKVIELHHFAAQRMIALVEELSADEWLAQPSGFANNIAWNVGHTLFVRQHLLYRNAGVETGLDESFGPMYRGGTAPSDWESAPDVADLLGLFKSMTAKLTADFEEGVFEEVTFNPFELGGVAIESLNDSALFNIYHEGLHTATVNDLRDVIRGG